MSATLVSGDKRPKVYGFNAKTNANEVSNLTDNFRKDLGTANMNRVMIYVLSGTHGDIDGNLLGKKEFFMEDRSKELQTVKAVNVNETTPANTWKNYFGKKNSIIILGWCFSDKWNGLKTHL